MNRDVIVMGASAGGLDVLLELAGQLPRDLPAAVFIVLHRPPGAPGLLPELLSDRQGLPARHPLHEERVVHGNIYIAPPDNHLLLRPGLIEVVRGPKESGHRPAVDALFRTASAAYGPRVIGVVLSGYQDCGTAGMMSIKARGGLAVVQSPETASAPDMPKSVLERVPVDHVVPPRELAKLLARLVTEPAGLAAQPGTLVKQIEGTAPGSAVSIVCPLCQGALTESQPGPFQHFRCHVGHTFTLETLVHEQSEELERALWAAVRSLEESAHLSQRLSVSESGDLRQRFAEKASTQADHANRIRQILFHGGLLARPDAAAL